MLPLLLRLCLAEGYAKPPLLTIGEALYSDTFLLQDLFSIHTPTHFPTCTQYTHDMSTHDKLIYYNMSYNTSCTDLTHEEISKIVICYDCRRVVRKIYEYLTGAVLPLASLERPGARVTHATEASALHLFLAVGLLSHHRMCRAPV